MKNFSAVAVNAGAASFSEIVACFVRVPTELVKQRAQAKYVHHLGIICRTIYSRSGIFFIYITIVYGKSII